MKSKLFLLFFFSVVFCSQPFLRKLDEAVTEESCKAQKKKFQAAVSAKCKIGETEVIVKDEDSCKAGTWTAGNVCSVSKITDQQKCQGTPTYNAGKAAVAAKCELKDYGTISLGATDCPNELKWYVGICSGAAQTEQGTCEDSNWSEGVCVDSAKTNSGDCSGGSLKWYSGICIDTGITSDGSCTDGLTWSTGICSASAIQNSNQCTGTPTYDEGSAEVKASCTAPDGTTDLTDVRSTQEECVVPLEWRSGSCSNKDVTNQKDCETAGTYTAGTPAKCVEADADDGSSKSSSYFLKAINFVLIAVCLLL